MEHSKMLNQLQEAAAGSLNNPRVTLGEITIISALLTEFAVTLILFEEVEKFREFNDNDTSPREKIEFNKAVADLLKEVCCIEEAIVKKIKAGIEIDSGHSGPHVGGECCKR
ncbi:hypothetical protein [Sporosarcina sp. D27]|uniref:hypothetical protein n=1 Tax=Sporosarcina sp. D27 TaxID=1382305 RepID=UPI000472DE23|nr:hypothetical protein [Sporosarcina sp. D27]